MYSGTYDEVKLSMFDKDIYVERRRKLKAQINDGVAIFIGNNLSPLNYSDNPYNFRQDSTFMYFFGINLPEMSAIIDFDTGEEILFGKNVDINHIIWTGQVPGVEELAEMSGVQQALNITELSTYITTAKSSGRNIHYLSPYRFDIVLNMMEMMDFSKVELFKNISNELTKAVILLREIKEEYELFEIEKAVDVAYEMHTSVMKACKTGISEQYLVGILESEALVRGYHLSFPAILSMNGEVFHNPYHNNILEDGRLLLTDAGAEGKSYYSSDITRTIPVNGKFSPCQRDIYELVLQMNKSSICAAKAGAFYKDIHLDAAHLLVEGLVDLGIMKGNINNAVSAGAHALFYPHGLGHMMGMDIHDMESLGEDNVGYSYDVERSQQFGLNHLRLAKELKEGMVLTVEPGCYFVPQLIEMWKRDNKFSEYINYEKVESYIGFGGIRIEDDIVVQSNGGRVIGHNIPKSISEIEEIMKS